MKPKYKLALIIWSVLMLNIFFGMDVRFTIINLIWCIPIAYEWITNKK